MGAKRLGVSVFVIWSVASCFGIGKTTPISARLKPLFSADDQLPQRKSPNKTAAEVRIKFDDQKRESIVRGMSAHDRLKDPFYALLIVAIEKSICQADLFAKQLGIRLTDSNAKSALNKARKFTLQGSPAPNPNLKSRDDIVLELASSIAETRTKCATVKEGGPAGPSRELTRIEWTNAIAAVEASLKIRSNHGPGERCYLDYIHDFIASTLSKSKA